MSEKGRCPACKRMIEYHTLGTNMDGEKILEFHYHDDDKRDYECLGSRQSPKKTRKLMKEQGK